MLGANENALAASPVAFVNEPAPSTMNSTSIFHPIVLGSECGSVAAPAEVEVVVMASPDECEKPSNNIEVDEETTQIRGSLSTQENHEHVEDERLQDSSTNAATDEDENVRTWRESPFAVGQTKPTWADENVGLCGLRRAWCSGLMDTSTVLTACICGTLGAGRVGNMVVLRQRMETIDDGSGHTIERPKLIYVVGPYWFVALCLTLPFFLGLSTWTLVTKLLDRDMVIQITWSMCNLALLSSLFMVSCQDPGILYRLHEIPEGADPEQWRWNSQAITYRPIHAKFDPECAVVIEHFDHTCPWTGTAIGGKNMFYFRLFLFFALATVVYNITLLMYL